MMKTTMKLLNPSLIALFVALLAVGLTAVADAQEAPDPRGPIENPSMKVQVDEAGVQTLRYAFVPAERKPTPWQAQWIWLDHEPPDLAAACLRKEVTFKEAPKQVMARMSADVKYRLWINGRLVSRGPVDIGRDFAGGNTHRWFYDTRDLTPFFKQGTNVLAVEVFKTWPIGFTISRGHGGWLFEADITLPDNSRQTLRTDTSWKAAPADYFSKGLTYDAAKEPSNWRLAGFNDASWQPCVAAGDVWSPLVASDIPPLTEARYPVARLEAATGGVQLPDKPHDPVRVTGDGSFRVVFDRVLSGYPTFKIRGGKGATLAIKSHRQATMIAGEGVHYFEFPFMDEIAPSFAVEIKNVTAPFEIVDVGANFTAQPVEYKGAFACSDALLNRLWSVSRWAVQINQQTHHLDSPNHQEPISDPGDYLIEAMVNYHAFAQPWLARQDLRKFAWLLEDERYHNFHTSYSLGWLQMLLDYYDYTGDKTLVEELAPTVFGLLDTYATWLGKNGILSEAPNYMFMDWVTIGGFNCHHPPAVIGQGYLTAFYCHGLDQAARVATLMGDAARAQKYRQRRAEVGAAFQRELWVEEKGLYRDGKPFQTSVQPGRWLPPDKEIETFSPHVNLLAVLYDLAPREKQAAIVQKVLAEKPLNTQPWFMHWVFQAIHHVGLFDLYGTEQLRRWTIVPQTQSFREMWNGGDLSHGWCSTPLVQMSSVILGVTPQTPGFEKIAIRPALCDLAWARGRVPTPHGPVEVAWNRNAGELDLDVTVPKGTTATVELPVARFENPRVALNGKLLPSPLAPVAAGTYHFVVTGRLKTGG